MLWCTASLAFAYESETQHVVLQDSAELLTSVEYSTGPLPEDSPVAVQFAIEASGGGAISMEGDGALSWPDALTLLFTPEAGTGLFSVDTDLDAVTTVIVDLTDWADYYGEFEIDRRSLHFDADTAFDPFLLPSSATSGVTLVSTTDSTQLITYSYEIWSGISLNFDADITPTFTVNFSGQEWDAGDEATILGDDQQVELTSEQVASYDLATIYKGVWNGDLSLVFTPTISLSAPFIDDIEIASFDIPVDLSNENFEQDFPETDYSFPLPWLQTSVTEGDLGDIDVGQLGQLDVPIDNLGDLMLSGSARIEGSSDFTVYPETFGALPGAGDGLVVSFAPTIEGEQTATLVLESNDPTVPELEIPLVGNGAVEDDTDEAGGDTGKVSAETSACGCSSTSGAPWTGAGMLVAGLLLVRRRR